MKRTLALKAEYFDAIRDSTKIEEYRQVTPFWTKRLEGRSVDSIVLTKGYPSSDDISRRIELPWRGYRKATITLPLFGPDPVEVFAIKSGAEIMKHLPYIYRWNRMDRKGQLCEVIARGTMNSCCVRFADGYSMVTSRNALKRNKSPVDKLNSGENS